MKSSNPYVIKKDPWSSHSQILKWLDSIPVKKKIIEVGVAEGILGKLDQNRDYQLIGIEINEHWADQAKNYYDQIIVGDIQTIDGTLFKDSDCVILADVLEHLPDPQSTLNRINDSIPSDSSIILSVPNVANIWVRLNLLFGKFDYSERGILDKTHLRFFTRSTFIRMINDANLNLVDLKYTPIPLSLVNPFFSNNPIGSLIANLLNIITKLFPTLFSFQMMALCNKTQKRNDPV
jgi:2-polyprenyl-3-methyl-5-hydroxy-6-metoxy-1,4-benzoquinol methylase